MRSLILKDVEQCGHGKLDACMATWGQSVTAVFEVQETIRANCNTADSAATGKSRG
jgi:hypothetical protein